MDRQELMARRLAGQHLTVPADRLQVCRDLNGLQAQFLSHAFHALSIRCRDPLERDTWGDGLAKSWTIRGTLHVFDQRDLPLFLYQDRDHFLRPVDGFGDDGRATAERKAFFAGLILERLDRSAAEREELKRLCTTGGMTESESESLFDPWGGLLRAMAERGDLCYIVQEKKAYRRCPPFTPIPREDALSELLRRYVAHCGPVSLRDAAYWLDKPQSAVRPLLDRLDLRTESILGETHFLPPDVSAADWPDLPDCLFLAGFDPLLLCYRKDDNPFLPPEHRSAVFCAGGIVQAAVLLHGRAVGKWKRRGKTLTVTLFESIPGADRARLTDAAMRLWPELNKLLFL